MRKLSEKERTFILESIAKRLGSDNILIVYADHVEGKMDTMMCNHPEVDVMNFGENAINIIRDLLHRIDRDKKGEQVKTE